MGKHDIRVLTPNNTIGVREGASRDGVGAASVSCDQSRVDGKEGLQGDRGHLSRRAWISRQSYPSKYQKI